MKFSSSVIEQVKRFYLLSSYIGKNVRLKKAGRNFTGLCPFHNEKTPSFSVNDEKGFYHCFGCGAHGDVVSYVMNTEGLTYPEAVERLAEGAGIRIERRNDENKPKLEQTNKQFEILEEAARQFEAQLNTPSGAKVREYIEKRGLTPEIAKAFRIGFAYDSYSAVKAHMAARFAIQDVKNSGLVSVGDNGDVYDRFRNRLIFPITNSKGQVIAFGGRVLDNSLPKYLNSPETQLFKKSETLYGLEQARKSIYATGKAIIVEGYLDVISLHQFGVTNAIAPLGTALTRSHLELLWRATKDIIVCLDGDAAGQNAMFRTAETAIECIEPGHEIYFASLPAGYDPDTFIRKAGKAEFEKLTKSSANLAECLWRKHSELVLSGVPSKKAEAEHELNLLTDKIKDPLLKKHFHSFFAGKIWNAGRNTGKQSKAQPTTKIANNAFASDSEALMGAALFKLIRKFPGLVQFADVESAITSLSFNAKELEDIRHRVEEAMFSHNPEALKVIKLGFDAQSEKFSESIILQAETLSQAKELWGKLLTDLNKVMGEKIRNEALSGFEGDMTEEGWKRFLALHSSISG